MVMELLKTVNQFALQTDGHFLPEQGQVKSIKIKRDTKTSQRYFIRKLLCVLCEIHLSLETEGVAVSSTADKV